MDAHHLEATLAQLENAQLVRRLAEPDPTYSFKHTLTQEAAYDSLLLKRRREIHRRVAVAYEALVSDRSDGYAALLALHYEQAGDNEKTVHYLLQAGAKALQITALREAKGYFDRAFHLVPETDSATRARILMQLGNIGQKMGDYVATMARLQEAMTLAESIGDRGTAADAVSEMCFIATEQGNYEQARKWGEKGLAEAREINYETGIATAAFGLGVLSEIEGKYSAGREYLEQALALFRALDNRGRVLSTLNSLGIVAFRQGDYASATQHVESSLALARETGLRDAMGYANATLGDIALAQGDTANANRRYRDALVEAQAIEAVPLILYTLERLAALEERAENPGHAAELLGLVLSQDACTTEVKHNASETLAALSTQLSEVEINAAMERGRAMDLHAVVEDVVAKRGQQSR